MAEETNNGYRHIIPLQIRFNDVDKFGHVNNTIHFQFYDTAKTDYIATVCKDVDWERLAIVVVKIEADFISQIKGNNHIAGRTRITKIGNKSFHLEQDIVDTDTQEVKSRCTSIMVLYDLEHQQTIPLPEEWRQAISNYEGVDDLITCQRKSVGEFNFVGHLSGSCRSCSGNLETGMDGENRM